ncbi:MAG: glycine oxidase ThiO [Porticoccaceae bacterium]|nr:glycine oxidase ThiO [Porticoccaceae bacterium]
MGRMLAFYLVRAGCRVTLFDKDRRDCGDAAAWTAAGMLAPWAELEDAEPAFFQVGMRSLTLWPTIDEALGHNIGFKRQGSLVVAHGADRAEYRRFRTRLTGKPGAGKGVETLDRDALMEREPALAELFSEAIYLPGEAWLDSHKTLAALGDYLVSAGVEWHTGTPITDLAAGVIATERTEYRFNQVVDTRGLGARPSLTALRGVRGEVLWLEAPEVALTRPVRLLHPRYRLYAVPREHSRYVLGATQIESDDRGPVTVRSALELLSAAYSLHPGFAEARVVRMASNCRPALDDNQPLVKARDGVLHINGLYRHGFLLAPALAEAALQALGIDLQDRPQPEPTGEQP